MSTNFTLNENGIQTHLFATTRDLDPLHFSQFQALKKRIIKCNENGNQIVYIKAEQLLRGFVIVTLSKLMKKLVYRKCDCQIENLIDTFV